jgi:hypothetical protein
MAKRKKKSKPTTLNWSEIFISALVDLLVGTLLLLISKMME